MSTPDGTDRPGDEPQPPAWDAPPQQPPGYGGQPGYGGSPGYGGGYGPPGYGNQPAWGTPGYGWGPPSPSTNGMAVASLVLGIIWIYWIGSVLALVFGYIARKQIRERGESGMGLATAGIVLGWIGVAILALVVVFVVIGAATGEFDSTTY